VFGHGTGSIHALFEKSAVGQTGAAGVASTNPHNQTLAVAIQLGLVGVAVLWAMWIAHLLLFRGNSFAEWIGLHCGAKYRGFAFQFAFAGKSKSLAAP